MIILTAIACILSGVLFRVRGGGWNHLKWWVDSATFARLFFAIPTAAAVVYIAGSILSVPDAYLLMAWPVVVVWYWLACTRGLWASYGPQPDASEGSSFIAMTGCGMFFLSPFYAIIYYLCYKYRNKLNIGPKMLVGWTAWAEFLFGMTIPITQIGIVYLIGG